MVRGRSLRRFVAYLSLPVLLLLPALLSCKNTTYFSTRNTLPDASGVLRIEYHPHTGYETADSIHTPASVVSDPAVIQSILEEINAANAPAPWKGAGWDRISIVGQDTTIVLHTNGTIIGTHASGQFFQLPERQFIGRYFSDPS